jgi:HlyD family secretion protein
VAELQIKAAEQSIAEAQKQLDWATITAPFDGTITSVNIDEGDTVLTTEIIVHLIDLTSMEMNVEVDEIDIAEARPGQKAITEVDALPALQLEGEVTSISLLPEIEAGVVVYEVKIAFDAPPDFELKVGMSADTDIIINERKNVLLVPSRAITQNSQGNPIVKVVVGDRIEERPVVTGISDGYDTEIVDGLNEGEVVVVERRARS